MKAEEVYKVVEKLIGNIRPIGETNTDNERFENLKEMCKLADIIASEIEIIDYNYREYESYSVKRASNYASEFLENTLSRF